MAIVKKYLIEISSIQSHSNGVYTLELKSLDKPFKYLPGQFLHLALDEYDSSGHWPESRCFSMQSSPDQPTIKITYAVKGTFTSRMEKELKNGSKLTIKLPYGDLFTQSHNKINTVFIAGGTGITPFLSLFNHNSFAEYTKPILYAGFGNRGMNLYKRELEIAQKINTQFEFITLYQDEEGLLNINKILAESDPNVSFFISGPPAMIKTFKNELSINGITSDNIKSDDWE